jgi:hypothetical protein
MHLGDSLLVPLEEQGQVEVIQGLLLPPNSAKSLSADPTAAS